MPSLTKLSVVMLYVVILSVIMLSATTPDFCRIPRNWMSAMTGTGTTIRTTKPERRKWRVPEKEVRPVACLIKLLRS
jgi:hypothetical protein